MDTLVRYIIDNIVDNRAHVVVPSVKMIGSVENYGGINEDEEQFSINLLLPQGIQIYIFVVGKHQEISFNQRLNGVCKNYNELFSVEQVNDYLSKFIDASTEQIMIPDFDPEYNRLSKFYDYYFGDGRSA